MAQKPLSAVVLAAGKGLRMRSRIPKVLHPIAGVPMLHYVLSNIQELSPKNITVVVGPGMKQVESEVQSYGKHIQSIIQKDQKGTGDAVKQAKKQLKNAKGTVLILFGDTPFITSHTMQAMSDRLYGKNDPAVVVLGFSPHDPMEYGRLIVDNTGKLQAIVEFKDADKKQRAIGLCNAGVMAVRAEVLFTLLDCLTTDNAKGEYYLTDIIKIAREQGHNCAVMEAEPNEVMGINTRDQLAQAEMLAQQYLRYEAMKYGATLIAPETVFLQHDTVLSEDVTIHPNVVFGPEVKVDKGVEIKSFSHIEGAHIKSGAVIGPYARIRPGTEIGEEARIGNFVEVKKSVIGKGVKAGHLNYIGDTTVGNNTTIGAGTITCNYDGKKKHKTIIGESAFIGSNSSLIAPIKVGKKAVIGAGSTVTKDVADSTTFINDMPPRNLAPKKKK